MAERATIRVTVLASNTVGTRGLLAEHGLAFWVEAGDRRLLFDTGQGLVLAANAKALSIDLQTVDTVVLSHGHYDHTGGLASVLGKTLGCVTVHAHPDALLPKFHREEAGTRSIGIPLPSLTSLSGPRCHLLPSREPVEVMPGVCTTGEIPRRHLDEPTTEPLCLDPEGDHADPLLDDQALFVATGQGTIVLLGCAHAGVVNTLDRIKDLTGNAPLRAVLGGLHLRAASPERLARTLAALQRFAIETLCPMHCTGMAATAALWATFPGGCVPGAVGTTWAF
jgi:7,8-dihydropterin-6-yl-methyl-4-(beta-D-ribofuranosyl)aminobenzene 5'-phosphate synthase